MPSTPTVKGMLAADHDCCLLAWPFQDCLSLAWPFQLSSAWPFQPPATCSNGPRSKSANSCCRRPEQADASHGPRCPAQANASHDPGSISMPWVVTASMAMPSGCRCRRLDERRRGIASQSGTHFKALAAYACR